MGMGKRIDRRGKATCATCGQLNVMHDQYGQPYQTHVYGKRHQDALRESRTPRGPTCDGPPCTCGAMRK